MRTHVAHLVRRAVTSWNNSALNADEQARAAKWLLPEELALWQKMQPRDCRHSLVVQERFLGLCPDAQRQEHAAALLHDVGKITSNLSWGLRILATLIGPRGQRFRDYHNHEKLGAELLEDISEQRTIALVSGSVYDQVARALHEADET